LALSSPLVGLGQPRQGFRSPPHRSAVVVLTSAADDEHLVRAMHAGATSCVLKAAPAEHLIATVRDAAAGTAGHRPQTRCSRSHHANATCSG
jgi:NarL family two-component system response regulator LiaR